MEDSLSPEKKTAKANQEEVTREVEQLLRPIRLRDQLAMHSSSGLAKGDISTLLARGHFYFALTFLSVFLTCLPAGYMIRVLVSSTTSVAILGGSQVF